MNKLVAWQCLHPTTFRVYFVCMPACLPAQLGKPCDVAEGYRSSLLVHTVTLCPQPLEQGMGCWAPVSSG